MNRSYKIIVTGGARVLSAVHSSGNSTSATKPIFWSSTGWTHGQVEKSCSIEVCRLCRCRDFIGNLDKFDKTRNFITPRACSSTTERDAKYVIKNNYEFTKQLANWSVENDVRFIYGIVGGDLRERLERDE